MITALALTTLLLANQQVRTFEIMNPEAYPGDTVTVRIEPQWQGPMVCIASFGNQYIPNDYGYVFIGVPLSAKPGKEPVLRIECGRGFKLDEYYFDEIIIVEKEYPKTRNARRGKVSETPCSQSQVKAVRSTYGPLGSSLPDLTGARSYGNPSDRPRDIIDHYGFIYASNPDRPHCGVDLRMPAGTRIIAVNGGIVVLTGRFRAEGNMIILNHGLCIFSVYMHLSRTNVKGGEVVGKGQIIGLSGKTGAGVREPHLHFNIRVCDSYVDPLNFIDTVNEVLSR